MIEVKNLVKRYGNHAAVNDLSFTVETGKVVGFLGPNGAGKSTTMNMITGYIAPTEGEVLIDGSLDRSSILLSSIKKVHCNIERITVDFFLCKYIHL